MGADLRTAEKTLKTGRYIMAMRMFRAMYERDPQNELAALGLARTQIAMGRCELGYPRLQTLRHSEVWNHEASNVEGLCFRFFLRVNV